MKKTLYKTVIFLMAVALALFIVTDRGYIGSLIHPLPFDGPKSGRVTDAKTGKPIANAKIVASWGCWDFPYPHIADYFVYAYTSTDKNGYYRIKKPKRRGGWFGGEFSLDVQARGYIPAGFYLLKGKTKEKEKNRGASAYPFFAVTPFSRFPETLDVPLKPAKQILLKGLKSDNPDYRKTAAEMLGKIGPEAVYAVEALGNALEDTNAKVRAGAAASLGKIGDGAGDAVPKLIKILNDDDPDVRIAAIRALGAIGCTDSNAVSKLTKLLNDKDRIIRKEAVRSLGRFGALAKSAVPALKKMLNRKWINKYMRSEIEYALERIDPDASGR